MKKKLDVYIKELQEQLDNMNVSTSPEEVLQWIRFYQHERFIHLIVTFFVGISCVLFLLGTLAFELLGLLLLFIITLCLFIPYIFYYYYLENNVQKLYDIYFEIKKTNK